MKILIVGCGYVGSALGEALVKRGNEVVGICRNAQSAGKLTKLGIQPLEADITSRDPFCSIRPDFDAVVDAVSSSRRGEDAYRDVYLKGTVHLLEWMKQSPPRILLFTSSTTVYAQTDGQWVDETSPCEPPHASGKILRQAEELFLESKWPIGILRLAGIYGPGRHALLDKLRAGVTVFPGDGQHYMNMAHRDDIVSAILAMMDRPLAGQIFNVVDDEPVLQADYVRWICDQLSLPMVRFDPAAKSGFKGGMRKGFQPNRRISNQKMKSILGVTPAIPNFRAGLWPHLQQDDSQA